MYFILNLNIEPFSTEKKYKLFFFFWGGRGDLNIIRFERLYNFANPCTIQLSRTFFVHRLPSGHVSLWSTRASLVPGLRNDNKILIGLRSRGTMVWIFYRGQKQEVRVSEFWEDRDRNTSQFGRRYIGFFLCPYKPRCFYVLHEI